jgi:hypothetical protein
MTKLMLAQVLARAGDQEQLGLRPRVTPADFEPPFTRAKLDDLSARLDSVLHRAREQGSGVIRVNLFARDGTLLYSDLASLRRQGVATLSDELLGSALAGSPRAEVTSLSGVENAIWRRAARLAARSRPQIGWWPRRLQRWSTAERRSGAG